MNAPSHPPAPVTSVTVTLPEWVGGGVDWERSYATDDERIDLAIALSRANVREGTGGPFGCAIFDLATGRVLGVGVNRVVPACNSALHGEVVAIMTAQKRLGVFTLAADGLSAGLYTSCEPCAMCLGATLWSGVTRLVCAATGDDAREIGFDEGPVFEQSYDYLRSRGIEVVRGLHRTSAREVLQSYLTSGGPLYNGAPGQP